MPEKAPDFAAHPLTLDEACALQAGEHCVILRIAAASHGFERVMNGLHRYNFYWPLQDGWWMHLQQLFDEEDGKQLRYGWIQGKIASRGRRVSRHEKDRKG